MKFERETKPIAGEMDKKPIIVTYYDPNTGRKITIKSTEISIEIKNKMEIDENNSLVNKPSSVNIYTENNNIEMEMV